MFQAERRSSARIIGGQHNCGCIHVAINQEKNAQARARLIHALQTGATLAVSGAGVFTWAGYGRWSGVIEDLARAVAETDQSVDTARIIQDNPNPLHCAQRLGAHLGARFREFIQAEFSATLAIFSGRR